jgi:hypothetical protein
MTSQALGGGEFALRLVSRQRVAPLYWRSNTHTHTYGMKHKSTSVKNPQAKTILECIHAVVENKLRTSELDMADLVKASDIDIFLTDAA